MTRRVFAVLICAIFCVLAIAPSAGARSAEPAPTPMPTPFLMLGSHHVLYVLATGADAPTRGKFAASLAERLERYYSILNDPWIIPEPDMTLDNFGLRCKNDSWIDGAIVMNITAGATGTVDRFFYRQNWTELDGNAMYLQCHSPNNVVGFSWASRMQSATQWKNSYSQLFSAGALLLSFASTVGTFIPVKQSTTATVTVFPTSAPLPPKGQVSQITQTNQSTTNFGSFSTASTALITPSLALANPSSPPPIADELLWNAAEGVVTDIVYQMNCPLKAKPPAYLYREIESPAPSPAPFCSAQ